MKKYEQIDISGDGGLRIWGAKFEDLFENAAEGMFTLITDASVIKEIETKDIVLSSDNMENLLVQWLNELVFYFDTYGFVGKRFNIIIEPGLNPDAIATKNYKTIKFKANISGGIFDAEKNECRLLIKAATYHNLSVYKAGSHWEAVVIFDI